jgi:hypothetical protein
VTYLRGASVAAEFELAEGLTVNQAVRTLYPDTGDFPKATIALVGARAAMRAQWDAPLPADATVVFYEIAAGGGGGGGSNPLQTILMVALVITAAIVAPWAGPLLSQAIGFGSAALWTGLVGAGIMMLGSLLMGAIFGQQKVPGMHMPAMEASSASPTYNINASGNQARLWQVIAELFGRLKIVPDYVAQTYMMYAGNEQYGYFVYGCGRGLLEFESFQFGETVFWRDGQFVETSGYYTDEDSLAIEIVPPGNPVTLFPDNVVTSTEVSGQTLFAPNADEHNGAIGPYVANNPGTKTTRILLDLVFQSGLGWINDNGGVNSNSVSCLFEYRAVDDYGNPLTSWITLYSNTFRDATRTPQRFTIPCDVSPGRYEIRGSRTSNTTGDGRALDTLQWTALRAILPGTLTYKQTVVAVRIRAGNALTQNASARFSAIATRKLPLYDLNTKTWSEPVVTRSWAAAVSAVCKQSWGGGLTDNQIDLDALWTIDRQIQEENGWYFDAYIDGPYTMWQIINELCQCVGVIPRLTGATLSFVRDIPNRPVRYIFHPRNIMRNTFQLTWGTRSDETPDDVSIEYLDADAGFANRDVRAVLPDSENKKPASLKLIGITDRDHAFRIGLMYAARNRWRRIKAEFQTENMGRLVNRGDVVQVAHPRLRNTASGKLESWDEASLTVWLKRDTTSPLPVGEHPYIAFTKPEGTPWGPCKAASVTERGRVVLDSGDYAALQMQNHGNPFEFFRADGDGMPTVWTLQESQEFSRRMIVESVTAQDFNHFTVTLVNDAPEISNYDDFMTPPWNGRGQLPQQSALSAPAMLRGKGADSGATLRLTWDVVPGAWWYEVEYSYDNKMWNAAGRANSAAFDHDVSPGLIYARARAATDSLQSPWTTWSGDTRLVPPDAPVVTAGGYVDGEATLRWPMVVYEHGADGRPDVGDDTKTPVTKYHVALASATDVAPFHTATVTAGAGQTTITYGITPEIQTGGPYRLIYASVYAINNAGMSDPGGVTVHDPAPPVIVATDIDMEVSANSITVNSVEIDENPDVTGFVIVRGASQNFTPSQSVDTRVVGLGALPYTLDGLNHNSPQYLRVAAKDSFYDAFGGVSGLNFTLVLQINTTDSAPWNDAPVITSPTQNQSDVEFSGIPVGATPVLSAGNAATGIQVQLSLTQDFKAASYDSGMAAWSGGTFTTPTVNMLTTYYVRVRVRDKNGIVSGWSAPVKFRTNLYPVGEVVTFSSPGAHTLTVPATGRYTLEVAGAGGGSLKPYSYTSHYSQPGGAGGYAKSTNISLTRGGILTCDVGAGGDVSRTQAETGGDSSISGYLSATGGTGGYATYSTYYDEGGYAYEEITGSVAGSPGVGSGGNSVNQEGGGGAGGEGGDTYNAGSDGWCRIIFEGQ